MADGTSAAADARRRRILDAAFDSFLRYGYSKVTLQDVAAAAGVSRPLIYTFFAGKEQLFLAVFAQVFDDQLRRINAVAASSADDGERLMAILEVVYLDLWEKFMNSAERADLLDAASGLFPKVADGFTRSVVTAIAVIARDETYAEHLLLSGKGMCYDRPATGVLRTRLRALVDIFEKARNR